MLKKLLCFIITSLILVWLGRPAFALDLDCPIKASSTSALTMDMTSSQVLYAKESEKRMNPIGISNILVALTAVNNAEMTEIVEITAEMLQTAGEEALGILEEGEKYYLKDLIYILLMKNDPACGAAIAEHVGGSQENFVRLMNGQAVNYQMTNSKFSNAMGFYAFADENYTDCHDTARLMQQALANDVVSDALRRESYELSAIDKDIFTINTNRLILRSDSDLYYPSATAGKSANGEKGGYCLVSVAVGGSSQIITVMFEGEEETACAETKSLFDWVFGLKKNVIVKQSDVIFTEKVEQSYIQLDLVAKDDISMFVDQSFDEGLVKVEGVIEKSPLVAPIKEGEVLGFVSLRYDGTLMGTTDLIAGNSTDQTIGEEITTPPLALRLTLLGIIIVAFVAVFVFYRKRWLKVTK